MDKKIGLSVVLPCYNEAQSISDLVEKYRFHADTYGLLKEKFQLVLVNNGSTDGTETVLSEIVKKGCDFVTIVTVPVNLGYGHGLLAGLMHVKYATAAFSHADEQCDPIDVFRAYKISLKNNTFLVKGKRKNRALKDRLFTWGYETCVFLTSGKWISEINAQPKLFPSSLISSIAENAPLHFAFDLHVLLCAKKAGLSFKEVEVTFPPRTHGESKWASSIRSKLRNIGLVLRYLFDAKNFS